MSINVAIDGPAGAGKSTIAKLIAKKMGYIYVDTGAMYRAMALYFIRNGIKAEDTQMVSEKCKDADISIAYRDGEQVVLLDDENVNALIRTEEVGNMASATSANKNVRQKLVELQKKLAANADVVMDGRDIGTVVLPDAELKIYLTASVEVRADRRFKELKEKNVPADLEEIKKDIEARDYQDMNREVSPLKKADDAVEVDTSDMTIDEVVDKICSLYEKN